MQSCSTCLELAVPPRTETPCHNVNSQRRLQYIVTLDSPQGTWAPRIRGHGPTPLSPVQPMFSMGRTDNSTTDHTITALDYPKSIDFHKPTLMRRDGRPYECKRKSCKLSASWFIRGDGPIDPHTQVDDGSKGLTVNFFIRSTMSAVASRDRRLRLRFARSAFRAPHEPWRARTTL